MEREVGGGIGMGNTCKPMAVSFQCMTKSTTNKKKKKCNKKSTWKTFSDVAFRDKRDHTNKLISVCGLCVLVAQSCPTLCDPTDCSPPGSSVHGIPQARILEQVAIPFSRGSSQPRDQTQVSSIAALPSALLEKPICGP